MTQSTPITTAVIYACDFNNNGSELGPETIARLQGFLDVKDEYDIRAIVLLAGYSPNKEKYHAQKRSFGEMMRDWLIAYAPELAELDINTRPHVWGTINETFAACDLISRRGLPGNVLAVTSAYHLQRVRIAWRWYGSCYHLTYHGVPWKDSPPTWKEFLRTMGAVCKIAKAAVRNCIRGDHGFIPEATQS